MRVHNRSLKNRAVQRNSGTICPCRAPRTSQILQKTFEPFHAIFKLQHMNMQATIEKTLAGEHLTRDEARAVMEQLLSGAVPDEQIVTLLTALREKGEQADELVGFAEIMRTHGAETLLAAGVRVENISHGEPLLDTCGTGGDGRGTFNVSTAAALVAAAGGVRVAKHGNRSISSRCGSADVLEALGVVIDLPLERIPACLEEIGMVFLFAPRLHLAMKHVTNARRALKTKSVFNLLGPLTNPLAATIQLVGVFDAGRTEMMAETLRAVGTRRAYVVAGSDGIDEITTTGPTRLSCSTGNGVETRNVHPEDFRVPRASLEQLRGGDAAANARLLLRVFEGELSPYRDVVLANAAAAFTLAGTAHSFSEGAELAARLLDSGAALAKLHALVDFTRRYQR
jgi:anthranilate phosphoribosyltransferase